MFKVKVLKDIYQFILPFFQSRRTPEYTVQQKGSGSDCTAGAEAMFSFICDLSKTTTVGHSGEIKPWHSAQLYYISQLELIYISQLDSQQRTLNSAGHMMALHVTNPSHILSRLRSLQKINLSEFSRVFHQYGPRLPTEVPLQKNLQLSQTQRKWVNTGFGTATVLLNNGLVLAKVYSLHETQFVWLDIILDVHIN